MKHHFVLVHGGGHGAWCWYKLVALLKQAGHKVTALDLGSSGINTTPLGSLEDYVLPLMEFMESSTEEKVVLVGHSLGGVAISLAMEKYHQKVLIGVYATALMPNCTTPLSTLVQEGFQRTPPEQLKAFNVFFDNGVDQPPTSCGLSHELIETMYHNCAQEDIELAKLLVRPTGLYPEDLAKPGLLTEENFNSVDRAFIVCNEDTIMNEEFQRWLIEKSPVKVAKEIKGADHMVMLSKPNELFICLEELTGTYHY